MLDFRLRAKMYGQMPGDHVTAGEHIYAALLDDLRRGAWPAGARLKAVDLADRYGAAVGVVRETLIRLSAERYIQTYPQRGFRTVAGTAESIWEQACFRIAIEVEGARLSIERGGLNWEADLSAAHYRLSHLEARMRRIARPDVDLVMVWSDADLAFHATLIAACGSKVLLEAQRRAFIQFRLHLSSLNASSGFRVTGLVEEHAAILEAALDRDADACTGAIRTHLLHYPEQLLGASVRAATRRP